jgi:hypothetical protein
MGELRAHGIAVEVPAGWDARIRSRAEPAERQRAAAAGEHLGLPVAQLASFRMPAETGDFGSGAVELMGPSDVFVSLLEFGDDVAGAPLYQRQGVPQLRAASFTPSSMQRTIAGQCGTQAFFTAGGRAFCAYAVLGRDRDKGPLVATVNDLLQEIVIVPRPASGPDGGR